MKFIFLLFILFAIGNSPLIFGQMPGIEWQITLGGTDVDFCSDLQQTADGGYIVSGTTRSDDVSVTENNGDMDFWIIKLNSTGNLVWQRSLGGSNSEFAYSIQQTSDGGYIVAGDSRSSDADLTGNHGEQDFWIVKLSASGIISWEINFGGSLFDIANSIAQTFDGGYIVAGSTNSNDVDVAGHQGNTDFWIVKIDALGTLQWQKTLGGSGTDVAYSVSQTIEGGYIVAGWTSSDDGDVSTLLGEADYWVVKLDAAGTMLWEKTLGGSDQDVAYSVKQTSDGGYIVTGSSLSNDGDVTNPFGDLDGWVAKLDSFGDIVWQKSLGNSNWNLIRDVEQTSDGGFVLVGETVSVNGFEFYWITRLSASGDVLFQGELGGSSHDYATSIVQTLDGGYAIAGHSRSDDGDVSINYGVNDIWIVKLAAELSTNELLLNEKKLVKITNILGQEVPPKTNQLVIHVFSDGTTEKVFNVEN